MLRCELAIPRRPFTIRVAFECPSGETFALFGPSGAGKSSILSALAGFEGTAEQTIVHNDAVVVDTKAIPKIWTPAWKRRFGYISQEARLFPHLSVRANLAFALAGQTWDPVLDELCERFQVNPLLDARTPDLSGGQAQRVALARALAARPRLLLLDEPFSALDWQSRQSLQNELESVQRAWGFDMILVTHLLPEAQRLGSKIGILSQGRLLQTGTPEALNHSPQSLEVAQSLGFQSFLEAERLGLDAIGWAAIHPDRVRLGSFPHLGPLVTGTVTAANRREGRWQLSLSLADGAMIDWMASPWEAPEVGTRVTVTLVDPPVVPKPPCV